MKTLEKIYSLDRPTTDPVSANAPTFVYRSSSAGSANQRRLPRQRDNFLRYTFISAKDISGEVGYYVYQSPEKFAERRKQFRWCRYYGKNSIVIVWYL